jgi:hypothetical protein
MQQLLAHHTHANADTSSTIKYTQAAAAHIPCMTVHPQERANKAEKAPSNRCADCEPNMCGVL